MSKPDTVNGAVNHPTIPGRFDYLFRVSLNAVIFNDEGKVLVVKEDNRDFWDVPGGGIDHGESIKDALARELYEEVSLGGNFTYEVLTVDDPGRLISRDIQQMRIAFLVKPDSMNFKSGDDGDEIAFTDPLNFKDSELAVERKIYEYSMLAIKK